MSTRGFPSACLFAAALAACGGSDSGDGDGGDSHGSSTTGMETTADAETGSGGTHDLGLDSGGDPYADCDAYCLVWLDCTDAYASLGDCRLACETSLDNAAVASPNCFFATQELFACIGMLDCAQLATLGQAGGACETEDAIVTAACGG